MFEREAILLCKYKVMKLLLKKQFLELGSAQAQMGMCYTIIRWYNVSHFYGET